MSDFIQIKDRIINKAHIVSVDFDPEHRDYSGVRFPLLALTVSALTSGDYCSVATEYWYDNDEATVLWQQLQYYIEPTVIQF